MLLIFLFLMPLTGIFMISTNYCIITAKIKSDPLITSIIRVSFFVALLISFLALKLFLSEPLLLDSVCQHGVDVYTCTTCNYICPHSLQVLSCNACMSMQDHLTVIAECVHNWVPMEHDDLLHDNPCDLGSPSESHTLYGNYQYHHYYCTICHAIICSDCYIG